ncbi:MAG: ATP-binding cassette domain-containing protein [Deltaproteobacteria bacterium]|nr:ATP-binding cassette domain-containing protein [Deltaproteobacteria bacterium]
MTSRDAPSSAPDAHAGRLERLVSALAEHGLEAPREILAFVVDFTDALGVAGMGPALADAHTQSLVVSHLAARTRLPPEGLALVVQASAAPGARTFHDVGELDAYEARFGPEALGRLVQREGEPTDLATFARRHGSADALLLLDAILAIRVARSALDGHAVAALEATADALGVDALLFGALLRRHDPGLARGERAFPLSGDRIAIGRSPSNDVVLADPQVAARHALLVRGAGGWRVVDQGSGRPTVVDGEAVTSAPLGLGRRLGIGPYTLWLAEGGGTLVAELDRTFSALSVRGLIRAIVHEGIRRPLLSGVSFTVTSGEVVAVVGPSGSGKTTLLNAITGVAPADEGEVRLDGAPFHRLLALDRSILGIVPQDDVLHGELTVEEALGYAGRLRFDRDATRAEIHEAVDRVVDTLDIRSIRHNRIGDVQKRGISGGQRKRVNLGQEVLTRSTRILFLDEPTSGLDPRAAQDIARLARRLADDGRIVFLVTHDLTPAIIRQVDHLLVLAQQGHLAFFGPPGEACAFFRVPTPDALFHHLDDRTPAEWAEAYRESTAHQKYLVTREFLVRSGAVADPSPVAQRASRPGWGGLGKEVRTQWRDLLTQTSRYARVKARDRLGAAVLLLQPALLAAVMAVVFPVATAPAVFMMALSSLWFGMSSSVRELIADRAIWRRERRVGARLLPYVGSKVLVLGGIVLGQCTLLTTLLHLYLGMGDRGFGLLPLAGVQALTGFTGMALGLLVSAVFASSEAAVGSLPLLLVPQIAFSSVMVPLRWMGDLARGLTWVNVLRYAYDASIKVGAELYQPTRIMGDWETLPISGHLFNLGLKGRTVEDMGLPLWGLCAVLGGFAALFLVATVAVTRWRDREGT